ncbi:hypothetical protein JCM17844_09010 [Iodidimonas gelatinilytica]|uniref:DUF218 domain-containing protein n=1 Tax=Iodidimonas gelatinilytica TaxID=1236966 RepID=A0A5A7MNQ4_9PROT|nr:YdcF family protein [Iodidimonas gelatinilytica]GEQ97264.1 hypothetical protein JCM17844_09010 [Iodidimonas gelatinilytica]GEQ99590.1 hypothetical protein JCM17845_02140 [Iodidimonas gelatinilytica]
MRSRSLHVRAKAHPVRRLLALFVLALGLWFLGFIWFFLTMPQERPFPTDRSLGGIVVFTGSAGRIQAGVSALEAGLGDRLLVSGVNAALAPSVIRSAIEGDQGLVTCCIDLGKAAQNTEGNAKEAIQWAQQHGYDEIMIITADWHMRRSLVELSRHTHSLTIHAAPVKGHVSVSRLALEYSKYLAACLRAGLE